MELTDDFRNSMSEWVELKKQLAAARNDLKIINTREKKLKQFIMEYMKTNQIDNVNLKKGKVALKTSKKKGTLTHYNIKKGLLVFFNNNETDVERAMNCIIDSIGEKETSAISLSGIK